MWSGSALRESPDDYRGAGLEIHDGNTGNIESFLKFRTIDPQNDNSSSLEIKTSRFFLGDESAGNFISGSTGNIKIQAKGETLISGSLVTIASPKFFLGGQSQFISGSEGKIEISSSNFHLQNDGDVVMQGTITAEAGGTIGGFNINANELQSNSGQLILRGNNGKITGSQVLFTGGKIGGFTLGSSTITGGNLVLDANGTIRSANFQEDTAGSGFKLTADNGGFLEVENARIRGTLKTAVFEKETVNAVGGELYIANSTVLTGSSINPGGVHAPTQNTMSVENASGFAQGEILRLKKVSSTGFNTEYVFVNSSSRNDPSSDTDLSGNLFVTRSYGNGISGVSSSVGETAGVAVSYSGSQVIVSTGRYISGNAPNTVGSGYMLSLIHI